jgi:hypothetical protein
VTFKARTRYSDSAFEQAAAVLAGTQVRVELSAAQTSTFAAGRDAYDFDLEAVLAGGDRHAGAVKMTVETWNKATIPNLPTGSAVRLITMRRVISRQAAHYRSRGFSGTSCALREIRRSNPLLNAPRVSQNARERQGRNGDYRV